MTGAWGMRARRSGVSEIEHPMSTLNTTVLLVEDHKNLAEAVGNYLESCGFTMDGEIFDQQSEEIVRLRAARPVSFIRA